MNSSDSKLITNYFISPHPSLQPFVDSYILCTSHGEKIALNGTWPASNETSLVFYMDDQPYHYTSDNILSPLQHDHGCIIGLHSRNNGIVKFNGIYHTFLIQFKANGYNKLFSMPAAELVNKLYYLDDVFGNAAKNLNELLQHAEDIQQMAHFADKFLLYFLNHQKRSFSFHDGITFISNELFTNNSLLSIEQYAYKANMSVRNFGRRFTEQVGVSPKLYCRLLRFNKAMNTKIRHPQTSWTSIAYECGYYDQMHLIKDFKEFANTNPVHLFEKNKEYTPLHIDVKDPVNKPFGELSSNSINEEFVIIKRFSF